MPEASLNISKWLHSTQQKLQDFKKIIESSPDKISQEQIDSFVKNLSEQMENLKDASAKKITSDVKPMEENILSAITILLNDPRLKTCKSKWKNKQLPVADFLNHVKNEIQSIKKKSKKIERSGKVEYDQL